MHVTNTRAIFGQYFGSRFLYIPIKIYVFVYLYGIARYLCRSQMCMCVTYLYRRHVYMYLATVHAYATRTHRIVCIEIAACLYSGKWCTNTVARSMNAHAHKHIHRRTDRDVVVRWCSIVLHIRRHSL